MQPPIACAVRRYARYRVGQELLYLRQVSPAVDYLAEQYLWWRHSFPEYVLPAPLPEPASAPAPAERSPPLWVPADALRRKVGVWERHVDNVLLFGHPLPTQQEVAYRRAYLDWCASSNTCLRQVQ